MIQHKQFVLFSGGLDSAVVLFRAMGVWPIGSKSQDERFAVEAISINYGQRHSKELEYAAKMAAVLEIKHTILQMPDLLAGSMLTSKTAAIPDVSYAELPPGISPTYVPFRNGLMISMLAAYAQRWVNEPGPQKQIDDIERTADLAHMPADPIRRATVYIGAHSDDAANDAYPDCSPSFLMAMDDAVRIGTYNTVSLEAPLSGLEKSTIVQLGKQLGVPFKNTWSCYKGETLHCGTCPTCRARKEAFKKGGVIDPTQYASG